jgi:hypothetical protein
MRVSVESEVYFMIKTRMFYIQKPQICKLNNFLEKYLIYSSIYWHYGNEDCKKLTLICKSIEILNGPKFTKFDLSISVWLKNSVNLRIQRFCCERLFCGLSLFLDLFGTPNKTLNLDSNKKMTVAMSASLSRAWICYCKIRFLIYFSCLYSIWDKSIDSINGKISGTASLLVAIEDHRFDECAVL